MRNHLNTPALRIPYTLALHKDMQIEIDLPGSSYDEAVRMAGKAGVTVEQYLANLLNDAAPHRAAG